MTIRLWPLWLAIFVLATVSPLRAGSLFEDSTTLEIRLTGQLSSLIKNKEKREDWPFQIHVDGKQLDLKVRARGNSRMRVCDFPPLRFNFSDTDTAGSVFEEHGKLKLVTYCRKGNRSRQDVLEEYVAYRIFNLLTEVSFRVRLVYITYNDTDGSIKKSEADHYGFLIEPVDQLTRRINGKLYEVSGVSLKSLNQEQAALVYVFQYLIGNTDWSFVKANTDDSCCHNIKLFGIDSKQTPVPYDFDLAGIVNASYAFPDPSLRIDKVWKRAYRGFCTDTGILRGALNTITSMQSAILGVISDLPLLTEKEKSKRIDYLLKFFEKATDEEAIIRLFERTCHP
jgi:hypothetical protein